MIILAHQYRSNSLCSTLKFITSSRIQVVPSALDRSPFSIGIISSNLCLVSTHGHFIPSSWQIHSRSIRLDETKFELFGQNSAQNSVTAGDRSHSSLDHMFWDTVFLKTEL